MLADDEDYGHETAPDLSVIKRNKKKILNDSEINSVFSNKPAKTSMRVSAGRERQSSSKKFIEKHECKSASQRYSAGLKSTENIDEKVEQMENGELQTKKIILKKNKGSKVDKPEQELVSVQTKNSINNTCDAVEKLYKSSKSDDNNDDNDDDNDSDTNDNDDDNDLDIDIGLEAEFIDQSAQDLDDDRKIAVTKQTLSDTEINKLKEIIKLFLNVDEKCTKLSEEVKDARMEKKQYEDHILDFMGEKKKEKITCNDSVLRKQVKQSRPKPKEDDIFQTLSEVFKDADVAQEITKKIFESVPMEEKTTLKKETPKNSKKNR